MITKLHINILRNAEFFQFMQSAFVIFDKYGIDRENLNQLYEDMQQCLLDAEIALAYEKKNEKVREKNEADRYRDRLHSKLFNHVKTILYDERDSRYDDAQTVMRVLKNVGNPTQLAENAESAFLTTLGNRLEPYALQIEAIGAKEMLEALMNENKRFIALEIECRTFAAEQTISKPPAMGTVRKYANEVYRRIVDAINGYANLMTKREQYRDIIAEMNVLVAKYDQLLAVRKKSKSGELKIEN